MVSRGAPGREEVEPRGEVDTVLEPHLAIGNALVEAVPADLVLDVRIPAGHDDAIVVEEDLVHKVLEHGVPGFRIIEVRMRVLFEERLDAGLVLGDAGASLLGLDRFHETLLEGFVLVYSFSDGISERQSLLDSPEEVVEGLGCLVELAFEAVQVVRVHIVLLVVQRYVDCEAREVLRVAEDAAKDGDDTPLDYLLSNVPLVALALALALACVVVVLLSVSASPRHALHLPQ